MKARLVACLTCFAVGTIALYAYTTNMHVLSSLIAGTAAYMDEKQKDLQTNITDLNLTEFKPIFITEGMTDAAVGAAFKSLCNQIQIRCTDWKMYGLPRGHWPVCRAKAYLPQKTCVIYSFGIKYDWSFDESYQMEFGCLVRSFDPSMGGMPEHEHRPGIPFYPLGLSGRKGIRENGWKMDNLKGFMLQFNDNNKTIPYIKFDIEGSEWGVLENLLQDGTLKNVMQLSFELHIRSKKNYRRRFKLIKGLESIGFLRWYSNRRHGSYLYQTDQSYLNMNFLHEKQKFR